MNEQLKDKFSKKSMFPGVFTIITIIFVIAKLWGKIDWSWFWVFSPLIFSTLFVLIALPLTIFFIKKYLK